MSNYDIVMSFERYFKKNNGKILKNDFSKQKEKFYQNTIQDNIVYSDEYTGYGEPDCSIWGKKIKIKNFLY